MAPHLTLGRKSYTAESAEPRLLGRFVAVFNMMIAYDAMDGTAQTVEVVLSTADQAAAIREANAVMQAGLLLNRELGLPSVVGGDLVFQAPNPAGSEGGIELVPPHRIAGVKLTPVPQEEGI
jgi:hypothetical protein